MTLSRPHAFGERLRSHYSITTTFLPLILSLLLLIPLVSAESQYRDLLPNGKAGSRFGSGLKCIRFGHAVCSPITLNNENNAFGTDFLAAGKVWTKELCEADSDDDGLTNGQELGDPCCQWSVNSTDTSFLRMRDLSNPGDASSTNDAGGCEPLADESSNVPPETDDTTTAQTETQTEGGTLFSTPSPTTSPTTSPSPSDGAVMDIPMRTPVVEDNDDDVCFPASASVRMADGTWKKMADIVTGDFVQVAQPYAATSSHTNNMKMTYSYSAVLGFSHRLHDIVYNHFVTIIADDGTSVTLTPGHYTYAPTLRRAREVRVGDRLEGPNGERRVVDVLYDVKGKGLFNPHTESGTIVVDGLVQSCYTESVKVAKAHALLAPVRALWKAVPTRYRQRVALDIADDERDGEQDSVGAMKSWGLRMLLPLVKSNM